MQALRPSPGKVGWRLFCAACAMLLLFRFAVPVFGYRRLARFFPERSSAPPGPYARRVAAAIQSAGRFVPGSTCLIQACAARTLLALRGYGVTMRVGVRKASAAGGIAAHAWLLSGDHVILGSAVEDFHDYRPIADFG